MLVQAPYVIAMSLVVAAVAVLLIDALRGVLSKAQPADVPRSAPSVRFLFDRDRIIDATPSAELFLARLGTEGTLKSVLDFLVPRFPEVLAAVDSLDERSELRLLANDGSSVLAIAKTADTLRLELDAVPEPDRPYFVSAAEFDALKAELARLRGIADKLPHPVWCEDDGQNLVWVNRAYLDLCAAFQGRDAAERWPLPKLFDRPPTISGGDPYSARLWIGSEGNGSPFEVSAIRHGDVLLHTAIPAESAVRAEASMRDIVQTLTKTFAQISIGLAVFGRDRRMVLFNPALAELTGLRPEALSVRPTLFEFLDQLRDRRMVPEQRNYRAWRNRLTDAAAGDTGGLAESWQLPDGRTFQVTALPQPEGATAILFEDITGQVVRNRSFRGTVELQQALLDRREEAMAVFAADGTLALCNDAYEKLWKLDFGGRLDPVRLNEQMPVWQNGTAPDPAWKDLPATAAQAGNGWRAMFQLTDGRPLELRAAALSGGYMLVEFHEPGTDASARPAPAEERIKLLA